MPTFLPDTSCIIAAVDADHRHHASARAELDRRRARGETMVLSVHPLLEAYSVLTRLPEPHRWDRRLVLEVLEAGFIARAQIVALDPVAYLDLLRRAPGHSIVGGRLYDAIIAACARQGGANALLTFDIRHFAPFAGADLEIVVPAEG
jgi:predicted nucleic acid-binding protein